MPAPATTIIIAAYVAACWLFLVVVIAGVMGFNTHQHARSTGGNTMPRMYSTTQMIQKLAGCIGTGDLTAWEEKFVRDLKSLDDNGEVTRLTGDQIEKLAELHTKHFPQRA